MYLKYEKLQYLGDKMSRVTYCILSDVELYKQCLNYLAYGNNLNELHLEMQQLDD